MNTGDRFNDFQLEEYKNISNAHFETNKQIGIFFRYFLLIASAPALIFAWFGKDETFLTVLLNGDDTSKNLFVGFFLIIVSIIGVICCFYLISLRLDSILYARTVNGIRKYFFNSKISYEEHYRILPVHTNQPKYKDIHTFGIIVISVGLINSIYFALGTRIIASVGNDFFPNYINVKVFVSNYNFWWTVLCFTVIFIFHFGYYSFISNYRRNAYMKSSIIGIDIDGVLNKHREKFCQKHKSNMVTQFGHDSSVPNDKRLLPEDVTKMPVRDILNKDITIDDEFDVFNQVDYWEEQLPVEPNIGKIIQDLKNSLGYKINIHSYRPWPQEAYGLVDKDVVKEKWKNKSLTKITKEWLKIYNIPRDNIFIEKSSIDSSKKSYSLFGMLFDIPKSQFRNRFYYTNKTPYRYFIEDSFENAIKLASTCNYVFLIEHPYNDEVSYPQKLPVNVIRVKNWTEIKNKIKELG